MRFEQYMFFDIRQVYADHLLQQFVERDLASSQVFAWLWRGRLEGLQLRWGGSGGGQFR